MNNYVVPQFLGTAFSCPYCNVYSHMLWGPLLYKGQGQVLRSKLMICSCSHCSKSSYWIESETMSNEGKMVVPTDSIAPLPHEDMPESIKIDYLEARDIVTSSSRGACALLRLAIQKLCVDLGGKGKNIDDDIAFLVKNGLSTEIQSALDIVRVVGNNSVHPGELSKDDIAEIAITLFELINFIVEDRISQPARIKELYNRAVPENIKKKRSVAITE